MVRTQQSYCRGPRFYPWSGNKIPQARAWQGKKKKHPFMIKILSKFKLKENFLSLMKGILREPTAHCILNRGRLKDFLQYSEQGEDVGSYPHLVNVGGWGSHLWNKEREIKDIWIGKEEIKLSPFMDNMIVHMGKLEYLHHLPDPSGLSLHVVTIAPSCMEVCSPAGL